MMSTVVVSFLRFLYPAMVDPNTIARQARPSVKFASVTPEMTNSRAEISGAE